MIPRLASLPARSFSSASSAGTSPLADYLAGSRGNLRTAFDARSTVGSTTAAASASASSSSASSASSVAAPPPSPAQLFRAEVRAGRHATQTSGCAPGFVQANFVALPRRSALDFMLFALRNPRACPLLAVTEVGDPCPHSVAAGADLRTDIPLYRMWRDGEVAEEVTDVRAHWEAGGEGEDGLVGFLLGCSFSWEDELEKAGLCPRHVEEGCNVRRESDERRVKSEERRAKSEERSESTE